MGEREIPQADLDNLQNLANSDFQANLGKIIHDIYLTGHNMFRDMPQGDHKKRAKYRFASKTLMRILPDASRAKLRVLSTKKPSLWTFTKFWANVRGAKRRANLFRFCFRVL